MLSFFDFSLKKKNLQLEQFLSFRNSHFGTRHVLDLGAGRLVGLLDRILARGPSQEVRRHARVGPQQGCLRPRRASGDRPARRLAHPVRLWLWRLGRAARAPVPAAGRRDEPRLQRLHDAVARGGAERVERAARAGPADHHLPGVERRCRQGRPPPRAPRRVPGEPAGPRRTRQGDERPRHHHVQPARRRRHVPRGVLQGRPR